MQKGKKCGGGLHAIAFLLLIIGGLNWLLVGIFQTDVGTWLGGMDSAIARIIYVLVGISALIMLASYKKMSDCRKDATCKMEAPAMEKKMEEMQNNAQQ